MRRRVFGLESEFGVTCTFQGQRRLSPDEVARYLFRRVVSWGRSPNVFLVNGARLYLNDDPADILGKLRDDSGAAGQTAFIDAWVGSGEPAMTFI